MPHTFASPLPESTFLSLDEAIAAYDSQPVTDTLVDASSIGFPTLGTVTVNRRRETPITKSAFVQLLHFVSLNWQDVKDTDPCELTAEVKTRLQNRPRQLLLRARHRTIQAVLSPAYTPVTNLDLLQAAKQTLQMTQAHARVTLFRGYVRLTGVTERVTFQPSVGDILSGGLEVTNNEFGKGALSVSQFVLRLVCTNGAVVSHGSDNRYMHRGWDREGLVAHLSTAGEAALSRLGVEERLREMAQTRLGSRRLVDLARATTPVLGKKGVEAMQSELTADSSLYDAYNHLTLVSQERKMGPRRELELIAGSLVGMGIE